MRKIVFFSALCMSGSLIYAGASWWKPETIIFSVAAGVHLAVLMFAAFVAIDEKSSKPPKRDRFVAPADGIVDIRVERGADAASAVARYAAEAGMEAYQSATAGFLLRDSKRKKIYRTRINAAH